MFNSENAKNQVCLYGGANAMIYALGSCLSTTQLALYVFIAPRLATAAN